MSNRTFCTPHLVADSKLIALKPLPLKENEKWMRDRIFEHPRLLPVDEIEERFGPLIPITREMQTGSGPVDMVFLNRSGHLTLVETKLLDNPESRRTVVAQILDYAAAMSCWTYADLCRAVRKAHENEEYRPSGASKAKEPDPIKPLVCGEDGFDEREFVANVSKNLSMGRFLLLIVGDGIHPRAEFLVEYLNGSENLRFVMALVELELFRTVEEPEQRFIQPRVVTRTTEIVRHVVVEDRSGEALTGANVLPPKIVAGNRRRKGSTVSEQEYFETLGRVIGGEDLAQFNRFLADAALLGVRYEVKGTSLRLLWDVPDSGRPASFGYVHDVDAHVDFSLTAKGFREAGLDAGIGMRYVAALRELVPDSKLTVREKDGDRFPRIMLNDREARVVDFLSRSAGWLKAMEQAIQEAETAVAAQNPSS